MAFHMLNAQDIIVTKQSTRIDAKIVEVSNTEIRYKKASNPDGPTFVMPTSEVSSILYANGEVQQISQAQQSAAQPQEELAASGNDSYLLYRKGAAIVSSKSDPYEMPDLKRILGTEKYDEYDSAKGHYARASVAIAFGWIDMSLGFGFLGWGLDVYEESLVLVGELLLAAADVLLPVGYIVRGVNAGKISRIAEGYNASHNRGSELSLSMSPTLMNNHGQVAPGVGLTLRF